MVERICPTCHQKVEIKTGLHNAKNLFKWPTLQDWISLAILVLVLVGAYAYNVETKACREMLKDMDTTNGIVVPRLDLGQDTIYDIEISTEEEEVPKLQG